MYKKLIDELLDGYKTYQAIADATGVAKTSIFYLHKGRVTNPSITTHNQLTIVHKKLKGRVRRYERDTLDEATRQK